MTSYARIRAAIHVLRGRPLIFGCHLHRWPELHHSSKHVLIQDCDVTESVQQRLAKAPRMMPVWGGLGSTPSRDAE